MNHTNQASFPLEFKDSNPCESQALMPLGKWGVKLIYDFLAT